MYDLISYCRFEIKFQCGLLLCAPNLKMRPTPLQPNISPSHSKSDSHIKK